MDRSRDARPGRPLERCVAAVAGRSSRGRPASGYDGFPARIDRTTLAGTLEDAADEVACPGGIGSPVPCEHVRHGEVRAQLARAEPERGRLDLLVDRAWGGHQDPVGAGRFREQPDDPGAFFAREHGFTGVAGRHGPPHEMDG